MKWIHSPFFFAASQKSQHERPPQSLVEIMAIIQEARKPGDSMKLTGKIPSMGSMELGGIDADDIDMEDSGTDFWRASGWFTPSDAEAAVNSLSLLVICVLLLIQVVCPSVFRAPILLLWFHLFSVMEVVMLWINNGLLRLYSCWILRFSLHQKKSTMHQLRILD